MLVDEYRFGCFGVLGGMARRGVGHESGEPDSVDSVLMLLTWRGRQIRPYVVLMGYVSLSGSDDFLLVGSSIYLPEGAETRWRFLRAASTRVAARQQVGLHTRCVVAENFLLQVALVHQQLDWPLSVPQQLPAHTEICVDFFSSR